jgi:ATP-binding cassette subfamily F protein uup
MALITLRDVTLGFRGPPVLDAANLVIDPGERVCLLGRNGTGKTSLLRLIQGELEPDRGEIARQQGLVTSMLPQEVPRDFGASGNGVNSEFPLSLWERAGVRADRQGPSPSPPAPLPEGEGSSSRSSVVFAPATVFAAGTVFDEVARGLGPRAALLADYHHVAQRLTHEATDDLRAQLGRIQHALEAEGGWGMYQEVESVISRMSLHPYADVAVLSAGMKRRVLLAKALVRKPDILLLDEPTNHLDIDSIRWLEEFLLRYGGAILFVTHDRALLRKLATRILELDRGRLTSWTCDYESYVKRKEAALETETRQFAEFDKKLAKEEVWIRTGIEARRTRNEGRVRALEQLREVRAARRDQLGEVRLEIQEAERSGRLVIEAKHVTFAYDRPIVRDLSTMIMRGDRVGLIGPNGSGKTTLLRLLLADLAPQSGSVRHGTNLEVAYFDQLHAQLDDAKTVRENVRDGSDWVFINGKKRHVIGYLEDFLFTAEQAAGPVSRLSGGERNRLLLARLFTKPSNVLVMDEPTNDLDLETLEILEDLLVEYPGTLLLVSHDREFLNNVVTSTLVLEGEGRVKEYAGGYDDWLRQRRSEPSRAAEAVPEKPKPAPPPKDRARRLTYKEQRELESLPKHIEALEAQLGELHQVMADPSFYRRAAAQIVEAKTRLQALEKDVAGAYRRWEELEAVRDSAG